MNELAATEFLLRSANELQTDGCTAAGRIAERIVRWCSSVIIEQYYILSACERRKYIQFTLEQVLKSQRQARLSTR